MSIKESAVIDLENLRRQLTAKRCLLQEVFCDLSNLEYNGGRQTVKELLRVEPLPSTSSGFCKCSFVTSIGFEEFVCVLIDIENNSPSCYVSVEGRSLLQKSMTTCLLVDSQGSPIDYVSMGAKGTIVICFPHSSFISASNVNIVVDCSWISARPTYCVPVVLASRIETIENVHPLESHAFSVARPTDWKKLSDVTSCMENQATLIQLLASVCFHSYDFPPIEPYGFRELYNKFEGTDFGHWQLLVGNEEFSGLLVGPSKRDSGVVDRVYGRDQSQLEAFMNRINPKC